MLQALICNKLGQSIKDGCFTPQEDTLTSSTIGLLQYLPSLIFWEILYHAIPYKTNLPQEIGEIQRFSFWQKLKSGKEGTNINYVEPDILVETEQYYIIIETKRFDEGGQYTQQWYNEIEALRADSECPKPILLIALGGNRTLETRSIRINKEIIYVYRLKWLQLLHAIHQYVDRTDGIVPSYTRIMSDAIEGFALHGYFDIKWLGSLFQSHIAISKIPRPYLEIGQLSNISPRTISKEYIHHLWKR